MTGVKIMEEKNHHFAVEKLGSNKKIYALMVLAAFFFGQGPLLRANCPPPYIPAFTLTFMRFSIATLVLYLLYENK